MAELDPADIRAYIDELLAAAPPDPQPSDIARPPAPEGTASDLELFAAERGRDASFAGQRFLAKVVDVYDGDTVRVTFRYGGRLAQHPARMAGYDSPELRPPKSKPGRDAEIRAARAARDALLAKLRDPIVYAECGPFDKYGRVLVTLFVRNGAQNGENINQWMLANGYGVAYGGGAKTKARALCEARGPREGP